jgi:hypothetical protein
MLQHQELMACSSDPAQQSRWTLLCTNQVAAALLDNTRLLCSPSSTHSTSNSHRSISSFSLIINNEDACPSSKPLDPSLLHRLRLRCFLNLVFCFPSLIFFYPSTPPCVHFSFVLEAFSRHSSNLPATKSPSSFLHSLGQIRRWIRQVRRQFRALSSSSTLVTRPQPPTAAFSTALVREQRKESLIGGPIRNRLVVVEARASFQAQRISASDHPRPSAIFQRLPLLRSRTTVTSHRW